MCTPVLNFEHIEDVTENFLTKETPVKKMDTTVPEEISVQSYDNIDIKKLRPKENCSNLDIRNEVKSEIKSLKKNKMSRNTTSEKSYEHDEESINLKNFIPKEESNNTFIDPEVQVLKFPIVCMTETAISTNTVSTIVPLITNVIFDEESLISTTPQKNDSAITTIPIDRKNEFKNNSKFEKKFGKKESNTELLSIKRNSSRHDIHEITELLTETVPVKQNKSIIKIPQNTSMSRTEDETTEKIKSKIEFRSDKTLLENKTFTVKDEIKSINVSNIRDKEFQIVTESATAVQLYRKPEVSRKSKQRKKFEYNQMDTGCTVRETNQVSQEMPKSETVELIGEIAKIKMKSDEKAHKTPHAIIECIGGEMKTDPRDLLLVLKQSPTSIYPKTKSEENSNNEATVSNLTYKYHNFPAPKLTPEINYDQTQCDKFSGDYKHELKNKDYDFKNKAFNPHTTESNFDYHSVLPNIDNSYSENEMTFETEVKIEKADSVFMHENSTEIENDQVVSHDICAETDSNKCSDVETCITEIRNEEKNKTNVKKENTVLEVVEDSSTSVEIKGISISKMVTKQEILQIPKVNTLYDENTSRNLKNEQEIIPNSNVINQKRKDKKKGSGVGTVKFLPEAQFTSEVCIKKNDTSNILKETANCTRDIPTPNQLNSKSYATKKKRQITEKNKLFSKTNPDHELTQHRCNKNYEKKYSYSKVNESNDCTTIFVEGKVETSKKYCKNVLDEMLNIDCSQEQADHQTKLKLYSPENSVDSCESYQKDLHNFDENSQFLISNVNQNEIVRQNVTAIQTNLNNSKEKICAPVNTTFISNSTILTSCNTKDRDQQTVSNICKNYVSFSKNKKYNKPKKKVIQEIVSNTSALYAEKFSREDNLYALQFSMEDDIPEILIQVATDSSTNDSIPEIGVNLKADHISSNLERQNSTEEIFLSKNVVNCFNNSKLINVESESESQSSSLALLNRDEEKELNTLKNRKIYRQHNSKKNKKKVPLHTVSQQEENIISSKYEEEEFNEFISVKKCAAKKNLSSAEAANISTCIPAPEENSYMKEIHYSPCETRKQSINELQHATAESSLDADEVDSLISNKMEAVNQSVMSKKRLLVSDNQNEILLADFNVNRKQKSKNNRKQTVERKSNTVFINKELEVDANFSKGDRENLNNKCKATNTDLISQKSQSSISIIPSDYCNKLKQSAEDSSYLKGILNFPCEALTELQDKESRKVVPLSLYVDDDAFDESRAVPQLNFSDDNSYEEKQNETINKKQKSQKNNEPILKLKVASNNEIKITATPSEFQNESRMKFMAENATSISFSKIHQSPDEIVDVASTSDVPQFKNNTVHLTSAHLSHKIKEEIKDEQVKNVVNMKSSMKESQETENESKINQYAEKIDSTETTKNEVFDLNEQNKSNDAPIVFLESNTRKHEDINDQSKILESPSTENLLFECSRNEQKTKHDPMVPVINENTACFEISFKTNAKTIVSEETDFADVKMPLECNPLKASSLSTDLVKPIVSKTKNKKNKIKMNNVEEKPVTLSLDVLSLHKLKKKEFLEYNTNTDTVENLQCAVKLKPSLGLPCGTNNCEFLIANKKYQNESSKETKNKIEHTTCTNETDNNHQVIKSNVALKQFEILEVNTGCSSNKCNSVKEDNFQEPTVDSNTEFLVKSSSVLIKGGNEEGEICVLPTQATELNTSKNQIFSTSIENSHIKGVSDDKENSYPLHKLCNLFENPQSLDENYEDDSESKIFLSNNNGAQSKEMLSDTQIECDTFNKNLKNKNVIHKSKQRSNDPHPSPQTLTDVTVPCFENVDSIFEISSECCKVTEFVNVPEKAANINLIPFHHDTKGKVNCSQTDVEKTLEHTLTNDKEFTFTDILKFPQPFPKKGKMKKKHRKEINDPTRSISNEDSENDFNKRKLNKIVGGAQIDSTKLSVISSKESELECHSSESSPVSKEVVTDGDMSVADSFTNVSLNPQKLSKEIDMTGRSHSTDTQTKFCNIEKHFSVPLVPKIDPQIEEKTRERLSPEKISNELLKPVSEIAKSSIKSTNVDLSGRNKLFPSKRKSKKSKSKSASHLFSQMSVTRDDILETETAEVCNDNFNKTTVELMNESENEWQDPTDHIQEKHICGEDMASMEVFCSLMDIDHEGLNFTHNNSVINNIIPASSSDNEVTNRISYIVKRPTEIVSDIFLTVSESDNSFIEKNKNKTCKSDENEGTIETNEIFSFQLNNATENITDCLNVLVRDEINLETKNNVKSFINGILPIDIETDVYFEKCNSDFIEHPIAVVDNFSTSDLKVSASKPMKPNRKIKKNSKTISKIIDEMKYQKSVNTQKCETFKTSEFGQNSQSMKCVPENCTIINDFHSIKISNATKPNNIQTLPVTKIINDSLSHLESDKFFASETKITSKVLEPSHSINSTLSAEEKVVRTITDEQITVKLSTPVQSIYLDSPETTRNVHEATEKKNEVNKECENLEKEIGNEEPSSALSLFGEKNDSAQLENQNEVSNCDQCNENTLHFQYDVSPERVDNLLLLDNTILKAKRDLKKRKVIIFDKRVQNNKPKFTEVTEMVSCINNSFDNAKDFYPTITNWLNRADADLCEPVIKLSSRNRSSIDGISPDNIVLEAQLNGIFGSVMGKHYNNQDHLKQHKNESSIRTSLQNEVQNIFNDKKMSKSKKQISNLKTYEPGKISSLVKRNSGKELMIENAVVLTSSDQFSINTSNSEIDKTKILLEGKNGSSGHPSANQELKHKTEWQDPFAIADTDVHFLPHYYVKPSGEVVRTFPNNMKKITENSSAVDWSAEPQNLCMWYTDDQKQAPNLVNVPFLVSTQSVEHPTVWFSINEGTCRKRESGSVKEKNDLFHEKLDMISERVRNKKQNKKSCDSFLSSKEKQIDGSMSLKKRHNEKLMLKEAVKKKFDKDVLKIQNDIEEIKYQITNPTDLQKLLKELDTQDKLVTFLHNQIQAVRDTEEYDLLSAELCDLQSNISKIKASAVSHYDFKQHKEVSKNQRNADIFKCTETAAFISNWITTVELKLASDDDQYLNDADKENHSYKVLSNEVDCHLRKIQESIHICNSYLKSGDADVNVSMLFDTMMDLQTKIHQLSDLISERLEALQVKHETTVNLLADQSLLNDSQIVNEMVESYKPPSISEINVISQEVQTSENLLSEKSVQTSLKSSDSETGNVQIHTLIDRDHSVLYDTEYSEDLSSFTNEECQSCDSISVIDKNDISFVEISMGELSEKKSTDEGHNKNQSLQNKYVINNETDNLRVETLNQNTIPLLCDDNVQESNEKVIPPKICEKDDTYISRNIEDQDSKCAESDEYKTTPVDLLKSNLEKIKIVPDSCHSGEKSVTDLSILTSTSTQHESRSRNDMLSQVQVELHQSESVNRSSLVCNNKLINYKNDADININELVSNISVHSPQELELNVIVEKCRERNIHQLSSDCYTDFTKESDQVFLTKISEPPETKDFSQPIQKQFSDVIIVDVPTIQMADDKNKILINEDVSTKLNQPKMSQTSFQSFSSSISDSKTFYKTPNSENIVSAEQKSSAEIAKNLDDIDNSSKVVTPSLEYTLQEENPQILKDYSNKNVISSSCGVPSSQFLRELKVTETNEEIKIDEPVPIISANRESKGIQCQQHTVDHGTQNPEPELDFTISNSSLEVSSRNLKNVNKKCSDTIHFAKVPLVKMKESTGKPPADYITEENLKENFQIFQSSSNTWEQVKNNIGNRIHDVNSLSFATLYLKPNFILDDFKGSLETLKKSVLETELAVLNNDIEKVKISFVNCLEYLSNLLEDIEHHILLIKESSHRIPLEKRILELNTIRDMKHKINNNGLKPLMKLSEEIVSLLSPVDADNCRTVAQMLMKQSQNVDRLQEVNNNELIFISQQWQNFQNQIQEICSSVSSLKTDVEHLWDDRSNDSLEKHLSMLENFQNLNNEYFCRLSSAMLIAEKAVLCFPHFHIPEEVYVICNEIKVIESSISNERDRILQITSLIQEYEQTLNKFTQIMSIADSLTVLPISVSSLTHLQDEILNRKKFYIDLNRCKSALELFKKHLDIKTREKYHETHTDLIKRASEILHDASLHLQQVALAVSDLMMIKKDFARVCTSIQFTQNQIPGLSSINSTDFQHMLILYQSLADDVNLNLMKITNLTDSAHGLRKIILCPELLFEYNKYKEEAIVLRSNVNSDINMLELFCEKWIQYIANKEKLENWMTTTENIICTFEPNSNMLQFWELQAQFEMYHKLNATLCKQYELSVATVKLLDEVEQKEIFEKLQEKWRNTCTVINNLQIKVTEIFSNVDIPYESKLSLIEKYINELNIAFREIYHSIDNEEQFQLYYSKTQVMLKAIQRIESELRRYKFLTVPESQKVGSLLRQVRTLEIKIDETIEEASALDYCMNNINKNIHKIRHEQSRQSSVLNQCENNLNLKQDDIHQALTNCEILEDELKCQTQEITDLITQSQFHSSSKCLNLTVSLPEMNKNIELIEINQKSLLSRSSCLLNVLKQRSKLWKNFTTCLGKMKQSTEETDFMMNLVSLRGMVDYDRLVAAIENLQGLSEALEQRQTDLLSELNGAAELLKAECQKEIQNDINFIASESVDSWNTSKKSLRDLCSRYERALCTWTEYRKKSDIVNEWVDNQLYFLSDLSVEKAVDQLKIYDQAINEQFEKLIQLRGMVMEITSELDINEDDNLLAEEILLLSQKLEDVRSALTSLNDFTNDEKNEVLIQELMETKTCISSAKKNLKNEDLETTENIELAHNLQIQLHTLARSDVIINNIKTEHAEILSNPETSIHKKRINIVELLESWQEVFQETFQQYHRVFSIIAGDQDCLEAIKLWKDYLKSIQEFLLTRIPDSYDHLQCDQQMCLLHENLLISQNSILLNERTKRGSSYLVEQLNSLTNLHNETLSNIKQRHDKVKQKLELWQRYREEQKALFLWLKRIENEQSRLNLRYLHLRTIDSNLSKIKELLERIPQGYNLVKILRDQQNQLLNGCGPAVCSSVKVELDSACKRIDNLDAALRTWNEFLTRIKSVSDLYEKMSSEIEKLMHAVQAGINHESCEIGRSGESEFIAVPYLEKMIDTLKCYQREVVALDIEFQELSNLEEKLKEAVDNKDIKNIKQKNWLLKQQQNDLKYQLVNLIFQLEEKLALWEHFNTRRAEFFSWAENLTKSLTQFSQKLNYPEVALRRLEIEFCAEVDSKMSEYQWLMNTGSSLAACESANGMSQHISEMYEKLEKVKAVWIKLNDDTKGEVEKIKNILKEVENLKTESNKLISWMRKVTNSLNKVIYFESYEPEAIERKLQEFENVEQEINLKSVDISTILHQGEVCVMDCDKCNIALDIDSFMVKLDLLDERWKSLQVGCVETKDRILTVWKLIQEVLSLCRSEEPWLLVQEKNLATLQVECESVSHPSVYSLIEETNALSVQLNDRLTQFKLLEELYAELLARNSIQDLPIALELLNRFVDLKTSIAKLLNKLNADLQLYKKFQSYHANLILRLSQLDAKLTQLQHLNETSSSSNSVEDKLNKLMTLSSECESLKSTVKHADSIKSNLTASGNQSAIDNIHKMANEYSTMYKDVKKRLKTLKHFYSVLLPSKLNVDEEVQVETLKFGEDFTAQVDTLPSSLQRKDAFLFELQNTMKESRDNIEKLSELINSCNNEEITKTIACCESSVDLMKHLSAVLKSQCNMSSSDVILVQVEELVTNFTRLSDDIRFKQHREQQLKESELDRLQCPLYYQQNLSQLNNDMWRLEKWLEHAEGTQRINPTTPPENTEQLEDLIQEHKEFMMYLDSHRDVIVNLNIAAKHLVEHSPNEEKINSLQERLIRINEQWEKVCAHSVIWQTKLKTALLQNVEFLSIVTDLLNWIEKTECSIKSCQPVDLTEQKPILERKYNELKKLYRELKKCEPRVASLQAASQICAFQQEEELYSIHSKLDHLRLKLQSLMRFTWLYLLKLGAVLGYDTKDIYSAVDLNTTVSVTSTTEFLDENIIEPTDRTDSSQSVGSNEGENQSVRARGHRFFNRVIRASLSIQALIFIMLGVASLFPIIEEEFSCATTNNMAWSLEPILRYPDGPPPT